MRILGVALFALLGSDKPKYIPAEKLIDEVNRVRQHPKAYADLLQQQARYYQGKILRVPGEVPIVTTEGVSALENAVAALRATEPLPVLKPSRALSLAAEDLVKDQGRRGSVGHIGSDGSTPLARARRHGISASAFAEDIGYGGDDARAVVSQLLIDDGVRDRGHRKNLLNPRYRFIGAACGRHVKYSVMCVIDLSDQ